MHVYQCVECMKLHMFNRPLSEDELEEYQCHNCEGIETLEHIFGLELAN